MMLWNRHAKYFSQSDSGGLAPKGAFRKLDLDKVQWLERSVKSLKEMPAQALAIQYYIAQIEEMKTKDMGNARVLRAASSIGYRKLEIMLAQAENIARELENLGDEYDDCGGNKVRSLCLAISHNFASFLRTEDD